MSDIMFFFHFCFIWHRDVSLVSVGTVHEAKFLVFFSAILELFSFCVKCHMPTTVDTNTVGTHLTVSQKCSSCKYHRTWSSQPNIGIHRIPAGNLLLSAAILYAGASPGQTLRVLNFLSVASISPRTFFRHQKQFLLPTITTVWQSEQSRLLEIAKKKGTPLVLGGDGRADSPGHCAKFGSYSMLDLGQGKVIDVQLVQVGILHNCMHMCNVLCTFIIFM